MVTGWRRVPRRSGPARMALPQRLRQAAVLVLASATALSVSGCMEADGEAPIWSEPSTLPSVPTGSGSAKPVSTPSSCNGAPWATPSSTWKRPSVQPTAPITAVPHTKLPRPAIAIVRLSGNETLVGELPLTFSQPASTATTPSGKPVAVRVQVLDEATRKASGAKAVLVALSRADGVTQPCRLHVRLNYTGFANAYGGDYANRVGLDQYPACVLKTPQVRACRDYESLEATRRYGKLSTDLTLAGSGSVTVIAV